MLLVLIVFLVLHSHIPVCQYLGFQFHFVKSDGFCWFSLRYTNKGSIEQLIGWQHIVALG